MHVLPPATGPPETRRPISATAASTARHQTAVASTTDDLP